MNFGDELSASKLIQNFINDRNGEFSLECDFVEILKVKALAPSALFLVDHDI
jgi:hypothetical protein